MANNSLESRFDAYNNPMNSSKLHFRLTKGKSHILNLGLSALLASSVVGGALGLTACLIDCSKEIKDTKVAKDKNADGITYSEHEGLKLGESASESSERVEKIEEIEVQNNLMPAILPETICYRGFEFKLEARTTISGQLETVLNNFSDKIENVELFNYKLINREEENPGELNLNDLGQVSMKDLLPYIPISRIRVEDAYSTLGVLENFANQYTGILGPSSFGLEHGNIEAESFLKDYDLSIKVVDTGYREQGIKGGHAYGGGTIINNDVLIIDPIPSPGAYEEISKTIKEANVKGLKKALR